jgi:hypothetical protein
MKKNLFSVVLALSLVFLVSFQNLIPTLVQAYTRTYPTCSIAYTQDINVLTYTIIWSDGHAVFDFGDGTSADYLAVGGEETFEHGYDFQENGTVSYTPSLTVYGPDGPTTCGTVVEISHTVRIPVKPICSIEYVQDFNNVTFHLNSSDGPAAFDFGDGVVTSVQTGEDSLTYFYQYVENDTVVYTPTLTIFTPDGAKSCSPNPITISHQSPTPVDPVCSIEYVQDFNAVTFNLESSDGPASFDFGDGVLTSVENGQQSLVHNFAYTENGTVSYFPSLNIEGSNGTKTCSSSPVTITHTPAYPVQPVCSIIYHQDKNFLNYTVEWSDGTAYFDFGDNDVMNLSGTGGTRQMGHSYAYTPNGTVTYQPTLNIQGPNGLVSCGTTVNISN